MWRKNRQPNGPNSCVGTDLNRNFAYQWSKPGASGNPCSETYYGSAPQSAPETAALDKLVGSLTNVVSYIDFHSYGQQWMYSWGWTCVEDENLADLKASTDIASAEIKKKSGNVYQTGSACGITYLTSGTTDDNMHATYGVKYSMTIELRDKGRNGFILPASQIIPTGEEIVAGIVPFWEYIAQH